MLKAADALVEAGHDVRFVTTRNAAWASAQDEQVWKARGGRWRWTEVRNERGSALWLRSGVRFHGARRIVRWLGPQRSPQPLLGRALGRVHTELVHAVAAEPCDLVYSGTLAALASGAAAARVSGARYATDCEDFHSEEGLDTPEGRLNDGLAQEIERRVLPHAAFVTAGSAAMAEAYRRKYRVETIALHNTFPLPPSPPLLAASRARGLRLYWFGQNITPYRGLEHAIRAVGMAGLDATLTLRGRVRGSFLDDLRRLQAQVAPRLTIEHLPPDAPDRMVALCSEYDVGLSLEEGVTPTNLLTVSNKVLTYPLAGLPVALTDTPGQRELARDLGEGALVVPLRDIALLAAGLKRWNEDRELLGRARVAAWEAARRRWHWEHQAERGALLEAVERALRER
jgi:glycosyltransferase involved in cell wall biosynthesis